MAPNLRSALSRISQANQLTRAKIAIPVAAKFATASNNNIPDLRKDTWNRIFHLFSHKNNVDGKQNSSAIFANSVFPYLDTTSAARIAKVFPLSQESDFNSRSKTNKTDIQIVEILKQELKKSAQEDKMKGLLEDIARTCLTFFDPEKASIYEPEVPAEIDAQKSIDFIQKQEKNLGVEKEKMQSVYGLVAGDENVRKKLAELWNKKHPEEDPIDPDHIVIVNSFAQAKYYTQKVGGRAFGLDNKFVSAGFVICKNVEDRSEIKRLFNLAMVSGSLIHQFALVYYLENNVNLLEGALDSEPQDQAVDLEFEENLNSIRTKTIQTLSEIYGFDFDPSKVFFGNGAQNFVNKLSAFLKAQEYENVLILASPYHLYPATIRQNGLNPIMIPVPESLRISPEFLEIALKEQYQDWLKKDGGKSGKKFKIAILVNEPENPSGHKNTSREAKKVADIVNKFAEKSDVEITYITDGAYKVLYGEGEKKYVQDYINKEKVNLIALESHSKSNWTFARLSFCMLYFNAPDKALAILKENEPKNLTHHLLQLIAMESRLMRKEIIPEYTQEIIRHMNQVLPAELMHVEGEVYPFLFPKFPNYVSEIAPKENPEFRMKIIKTIFSAKFSNIQLSQIFNLEINELETGELKNILENFHNQKFEQKEVDILIDRMIEKENSFEDRVSVLCDSISTKSDTSMFDEQTKSYVHQTIFELKKLGKLDTPKAEKALSNIKQMMEILGVDFDDNCNLENAESKNNLLNKINEELHNKDFSLGYVNCRNTLFSSFALMAYNGLCVANIWIGSNGRITPRPAFGGLQKEEVTERLSLLKDFLEFTINKEQTPNSTIETKDAHDIKGHDNSSPKTR